MWQQMWLRATEVDRPKNALTALAKTDAVALDRLVRYCASCCLDGSVIHEARL